MVVDTKSSSHNPKVRGSNPLPATNKLLLYLNKLEAVRPLRTDSLKCSNRTVAKGCSTSTATEAHNRLISRNFTLLYHIKGHYRQGTGLIRIRIRIDSDPQNSLRRGIFISRHRPNPSIAMNGEKAKPL